ncbi:hypothetical protein KDD30_17450 (plasmid) [Photobacterium sp. GJ3]|uniref:hypothetical protein n=1 Tax=Photobacterium sp. GJ3 TaxID=2829502 RepID=UPI001B8D66B6|nr:hypothetical protein [Photobacterium sp. GJ3]QUJ69946.1 hypothetical protein KDD30_17450 [Photobacterium sp. GJ3]
MEQVKSQQGSIIRQNCSQHPDVALAHQRHWVPACAGTTNNFKFIPLPLFSCRRESIERRVKNTRKSHGTDQITAKFSHSVESFTAPGRGFSASTSLGSRLRGNDKGLINHHITVIPAQAGIHRAPG